VRIVIMFIFHLVKLSSSSSSVDISAKVIVWQASFILLYLHIKLLSSFSDLVCISSLTWSPQLFIELPPELFLSKESYHHQCVLHTHITVFLIKLTFPGCSYLLTKYVWFRFYPILFIY
jgi:hypothetical protein